jgi:hypothetical protein
MKAIYYVVFIGVFLCFAFAKAETTTSCDKECIYVAAKSGLNMRNTAGQKGKSY